MTVSLKGRFGVSACLVAAVAMVLLIQLLAASAVLAEQTTLKLQILPIDCQFEIINDGQNTIRYLTPEECGQAVDEPDPEPGDESPGTRPQPSLTPDSGGRTPFLFAVPEDQAPTPVDTKQDSPSAGQETPEDPFEPLVSVRKVGQAAVQTVKSEPLIVVAPLALVTVAAVDAMAFNATLTSKVRSWGQWLSRKWWR